MVGVLAREQLEVSHIRKNVHRKGVKGPPYWVALIMNVCVCT